MSTRSYARNIFPSLDNPELTIRRRSRADPTLLNDFEMDDEENGDPPLLDLRTMKELCQPSLNVRGGPISPVAIQATNFGLKNDMIQQVQNSCQFHKLSGDDVNKHLDKFLHVTHSIKVNGVTDDSLRLNEITNFRQRPDESLFEAWERYNLSIDRCPNHNMLPVTQIDTLYNILTLRHRDTINNAAGGTFLKRHPEECYDLFENMTAHHNDWDLQPNGANRIDVIDMACEEYSQEVLGFSDVIASGNPTSYYDPIVSTSSLTLTSFENSDFLLEEELKICEAKSDKSSIDKPLEVELKDLPCNTPKNACRSGILHGPNPPPAYQATGYQASVHQPSIPQPSIPQPQVVTTNKFTNYMKANDAILKNMQTNMTSLTNSNLELKKLFSQFMKMNTTSSSGSGTLPSNAITNPKEDLKGITTRSGNAYQGPMVPTTSSSLPQVVERETETGRALIDVFKRELTLRVGKEAITFNLDQMSRYSANYNDMTANRIDVIDMACEEYSDSDFLLEEVDAFLALEDDATSPEVDHSYFDTEGDILLLEAFLNDDPSLPPPTQGNYLPQVRKELKICEAKNDKSSINEPPEVELKDLPPHLEYAFLEGELTLRIGKEAITFNLDQTSRYSANYNDMTANRIDVIDMAYKEYLQEILGFSDVIVSGNPTPYFDLIVSTSFPTLTPSEDSDFLLKEVDAFLALEDDSTSSKVDHSYYDTEGDILLLEAFLNDDPSLPLPNQGNSSNSREILLKIGKYLIDVYEGELTLRIGKEAITFNLDQTSRYSANYNDMTANRIDVIDMAYKEYLQEILGFSDVIASGNPTPYFDLIVSTSFPTLTPSEDSDFLLKEVDAFLALEDDSTSSKVDHSYYDTEGDILLLEAFLNDDPSLPLPNQGKYLPQVQKEFKIYEAKNDKPLIDKPPEVELKDLPPHLEYVFLEGDDKLPVIISKDLSVEEKAALIKVLKSHK
nr:hypothetical protein [Tanacetum cinerariifolium]